MSNEKKSYLEMSDDEFLDKEVSDIQETPSNDPEPTNQENNYNEPQTNESVNEEPEEDEDVDYEAFYKEVTAPFMADGKQVSAKTSKEIISLMQKGTDYTHKTQKLAANKKVINFLQQQQLLDTNKLELLADVANGDKDAIKKLLKDKKIDVLDLEDYDDDDEPSKEYVPKAKMPSDASVALYDTVSDISSKENGLNILNEINSTFDPESIKFIETQPAILNDLYLHKQNGLFNKIKDEVNRRISLNQLNPNTPFIGNYAVVFKEMSGGNQISQQQLNTNYPTSVNNQINTQIRGARSTSSRGTSRPSGNKKNINYLEMSDEEFIKQFGK